MEVKKLHDKAILPTRANPWDAGLDLYLCEDVFIYYNEVVTARTGIAIAIPQGNFGMLVIRSGLGKRGIQLANAPGIIDAGYRGEIKLMLTTEFSHNNLTRLNAGERVAQLVIVPFRELKSKFVDELPVSDGRETGGFGSSGK